MKITKKMERAYERSKEDKRSDRVQAKKHGMTVKQWEKSPMDRKMDRAAIKKKRR